MRWLILLAMLLLPPRAQAVEMPRATQSLAYTAYVAGMAIFHLNADLDLRPDSYRVDLASHTTGLYGMMFNGETLTLAQGRWMEGTPYPLRYAISGHWRGRPRRTLIDYAHGVPAIRLMQPPNAGEREEVPADEQRDSVDTVSAAAMLVHRITTTGLCDGEARTFDGRRLSQVAVRSAGWETLPQTSRSNYAGPALRCDFDARLLYGFMLDADRASAGRPQRGSAWLASALPGGPLVPVRMAFEIRWFGAATMYLTAARSDGTTLVRERADTANGVMPLLEVSAPVGLAPPPTQVRAPAARSR